MANPGDNDSTTQAQGDQDKMAAEWAAMAEEKGGDDQAQDDQDKVAAEWAAMAEEGGGDEGQDAASDSAQTTGESDGEIFDDPGDSTSSSQPTRVLNQDEIDSLLGFGDGADESQGKVGMHAIFNSALVTYERLPMLEVVFDRLVRLMTTSLRNFTSDNVEVSLDRLTSVRFGDFLNSIPLPALLTVFRAEEWEDFGLIAIDSALIYSVVDSLLGGGRHTAPIRIEGRPYTTIERSLVERMIRVVLGDLSAAFDPLTKVTFRFDRLETNPRFAAIARSANAAITVRMRVDMDDRGGNLELVLPYATIEPIRDLLLQMFWGEKFGRDSIWESHLAGELWKMSLNLEAVLDEQVLPLNKVASLRLGDTLMLQAQPNSPIILRCGGINMLKGHMGRAGNQVAIRVDETLLERDETP